MQRVCNAYAREINRRLKRRGHFFHSRFEADSVRDGGTLLRTSFDLHRKPVDAGLCKSPGDWLHSSVSAYIKGRKATLANTDLILKLVGGPENYVRFLNTYDRSDPASAEEFIIADHDVIEGMRCWGGGNTVKAKKG